MNLVVDMGKTKSDFVVIHTAQGEITANVMKSHLESEGIPVLLKYESAGVVYGLTINGLGEVKILVPQDLVEEAKRITKTQEYSSPLISIYYHLRISSQRSIPHASCCWGFLGLFRSLNSNSIIAFRTDTDYFTR